MKKTPLILSAIVWIFPLISLAGTTPTTVHSHDDIVTVTTDGTQSVYVFASDGEIASSYDIAGMAGLGNSVAAAYFDDVNGWLYTGLPDDFAHFIIATGDFSCPYNGSCTYSSLLATIGGDLVSDTLVSYVPSSPSTGLAAIIDDANSRVQDSVGFTLADPLNFMKAQFLLIMGGGLGMLQGLMVYIVFLAIAVGVIYFLYRAFAFFRH